MAFAKIAKLAAAVAAMVLISDVTETNACSCPEVYFTPCAYYVVGDHILIGATLVIRATALSRSQQTDINDPVTYVVDVTFIFLGDTGGETEISFTTAGNSAACGIHLDIGEEYVLALSPAVANPFDPTIIEGELTVDACGLWRKWDDIPDGEKSELEAGCVDEDPCLLACDDLYQECVQYQRNGKYYCSDTCDGFPCPGEERCTTQPRKWCRSSGFEGCPEKRTCSAV